MPDGFRPFPHHEGFIGSNGPLYIGREGEEYVLGARILPRHCNPMMIAHGGWLATLLDMTLPICARHSAGVPDNFLLTISLTLDYLGGAKVGSWVTGRAEVLKRTKRLVFVQGALSVDGEAITRGSGVFRIGPEAPPIDQSGVMESAGG